MIFVYKDSSLRQHRLMGLDLSIKFLSNSMGGMKMFNELKLRGDRQQHTDVKISPNDQSQKLGQKLKKGQVRLAKMVEMAHYLPKRIVPSTELDLKLLMKPGYLEKLAGVKTRHYVDPELETNSYMGAMAAQAVLKKANLKYEDIDAIVCASGTYEQPIPCTAALIQRAMGKQNSGTPCFDINATCLGFVIGMDVVSSLVEAGRFNRVLLISSEIASVGLPWNQHEACALFGDGAVAAIVERTPVGENSHVIAAHQVTYSSGAETCQIVGGGTRVHSRNFSVNSTEQDDARFLFSMDGRKVFKQASEHLPAFAAKLEELTGLNLKDYDYVVPHQASASAMDLMRRKLGIPVEKFANIVEQYGNMIAASIPLALSLGIESGKVKRGSNVLLLGTSAGFSIGAISFVY
jgi:3-oxoacyl-[acyl-carrier-protein] synthase-3